MKTVQDKLRRRQSRLFAAIATLLLLSLYLVFIYQNRLSDVSDGMSRFQTQMVTILTDNELIADATGVRFRQLSNSGQCGNLSDFTPRDHNNWAINGNRHALDPDSGTMITRALIPEARCMFTAAEFIRQKINTLNPGRFDAHRYIIAKDASWFYWFSAADSLSFQFSDSKMASTPGQFFRTPETFYDRLLQKDLHIKALSSTDLYIDKITGDLAYSLVSYIYNLSGATISDEIIAYVVYDHSRPELRERLLQSFNNHLPGGLKVKLVNSQRGESLCLTGECDSYRVWNVRPLSGKYAVHSTLPVRLFLIDDPQAWFGIILSPLGFLLLAFFIRLQLNRNDIRMYSDPLTGCFTRKILDVIRASQWQFSSVILMDCNKFKVINDRWGHDAGDRALQSIASHMMNNLRSRHDVVVRTGGDEFVIFLHQADFNDAHNVAVRISHEISDHVMKIEGATIALSVSWGAAVCTAGIDAAIQRADEMMYRMKQRAGVTTNPVAYPSV